LAALAKSVGVMDLPPEEFVGLRRRALEYHGWWTFDETNAIARHVSLNIPVDNFLDRCMSLEKLIVEGLSEASLRKLLVAIGVPDSEIAKFGSLKLLDCIVRMAQVAHKTGLNFKKNDPLIWDRLKKEGTIPTQPIIRLFALHDMRVLKAHKTGDRDKTLAEELKRFGIAFGEGAAGYGKVLDQIYDSLLAELREANARIDAAR